MTRIVRRLFVTKTCASFMRAAILAASILITFVCSCAEPLHGTGREWLSWNAEQRISFVDGFTTGYIMGTHKACAVTGDLMEVGKPQQVGQNPSERCLARLATYSKNPGSYTSVLTEFYTVHSQYRNIPVLYLLRFLSDQDFKGADELYQMALNGKLRTVF